VGFHPENVPRNSAHLSLGANLKEHETLPDMRWPGRRCVAPLHQRKGALRTLAPILYGVHRLTSARFEHSIAPGGPAVCSPHRRTVYTARAASAANQITVTPTTT